VSVGRAGQAVNVTARAGSAVPRLMGVLNCTPDSFHAASRVTCQAAIERGMAMLAAGADILDVGGESTRPGADRVDADRQIERVVPVIRALRAGGASSVSVDTTLARVAAAAIRAGATMVNDVSGGTEDPEILRVAADAGVELVLMHRLHPPEVDSYSDRYLQEPVYGDVVREVGERLMELAAAAERAGVARERITLDPGFGFGKSVKQNMELLGRLAELTSMGWPILVGASRKSFLGAVTGASDPADRLAPTLAAALLAMQAGAAVLRVHDVGEHAAVRAVFRAAGRC
jgi:dihydropteroate synthase